MHQRRERVNEMKSHMRDSNNWYPKAEKNEESELPGQRSLQAAEKKKKQPAAVAQLSEINPVGLTGVVAVFETDECGFISSWSAKAEQVYGYESIDMVGKHIA